MSRRLFVDADLDMTVDGHPVTVRGAGQRVVVDVGDPETAWKVFGGRKPGRSAVRSFVDLLEEFGVDVEVVVGDRPFASVGPSAVAGRLARAAGFDGVQVSGGAAASTALAVPQIRQTAIGAAFVLGLLLGLRR